MYETGMDKKLVRDLTRHCSNAVLKYKHTSNDMKNHVSQVLYGNQNSHVPAAKLSCKSPSATQVKCELSLTQPCNSQLSQTVSQSMQNSQNLTSFTVNCNIPRTSEMPVVNVYPIINILQGLNPGMPVIINVNLHMDSSQT